MSTTGINETKEALAGVNELAIALIGIIKKDGASVQAAVDLIEKFKSDDAFKTTLEAAVQGISAVPAELKDIDMSEMLELGAAQVTYLPKFIDALKA